MQVGDLVKSRGFGPNGSVGEGGLIVKHDGRFLRHLEPAVWIVMWSNGALSSCAQDVLIVVSEAR